MYDVIPNIADSAFFLVFLVSLLNAAFYQSTAVQFFVYSMSLVSVYHPNTCTNPNFVDIQNLMTFICACNNSCMWAFQMII